MAQTLVSALCACHNCSHLLPMALASLRAQTWLEWECIVVDDGSDDSPDEVVARAQDERVTVVRLDRNRGRGYARQYAQQFLQGDLVTILDADDWWYPAKLERQVAYLDTHPEVGLVGSGLAIVGAEGQLLGTARCASFKHAPENALVPRVGFPSLCIRRSVLERHPFDTTYGIAEDREWLTRVLRREWYANIGTPLYAYYEGRAESIRRYWGTSAADLRTFARCWRYSPAEALRQSVLTAVKAVAYGLAALVRRPGLVARRHRASASDEATAEHARALAAVLAERDRLFGSLEHSTP